MAQLKNDESTLLLEINLLKYIDDNDCDSDLHKFIDYNIKLDYGMEVITYEENQKISLYLVEYLIDKLKQITIQGLIEEPFEINPLDNSFYLKISDRGIDNVVEIEVWFYIGKLSKGNIIGFSKGVKFDCELEVLRQFAIELQQNYNDLLKRAI